MIFIKDNKEIKFKKKLNEKIIKNLFFDKLKALSFTELNNSADILSFINNCKSISTKSYSKEKINNIIFNEKYVAYIYYNNDNPLGYLIAYIDVFDNIRELKIENIGILGQYQDKNFELEFIKNILLKSWKNKRVDTITITFKTTEDKMKKNMKELNFDKSF
ncbi:MAG: hypothetical protein ACQEQD_04875 [Bacillota bacterium]